MEHGSEVAGISKAYTLSDHLDLQLPVCQKQLLGTADPVEGQVFIDRTAKKTKEEPGQILLGDVQGGSDL